jgi:POT family proton-dependent oligopeptide transporter
MKPILLSHHPKTLWILSLGKLWDTFSYFGTQTILVLYLIHTFHFSRSTSFLIYGAFTAFLYAMPVVGGYISDHWLPVYKAVILGNVLVIVGNLLLMVSIYYFFCLGLAFSIMGSALYRSSLVSAVGNLYPDFSQQKEAGYTWLYLTTNIGGTLGPLVFGIVGYRFGLRFGFLCSAIGVFISLLWYLRQKDERANYQKTILSNPALPSELWLYPLILIICLILSFLFYSLNWLNPIINGVFIVSILFLILLTLQYRQKEQKRLITLLLMSFFGMFYFAAGLQIGALVTIFIQNQIHAGVIKTKLPASTFSMLYPLFVLILAPFVTKLWKFLLKNQIELTAFNKLAIGIALAALGMLSFAFASYSSLILFWILLGNALLAGGELVLTPAAFATLNNLSPQKMRGTMIGGWFLFIGFGGYLSGLFANTANYFSALMQASNKTFMQFIFIAGVTLLVSMVVALIAPLLKRMSA